jgi:hypothetical protein
MLNDLPENLIKRQEKIIDIIKNEPKRMCHLWTTIKYNQILYVVSRDAIKIDGIRINLSSKYQQELAEEWGACLLTPRVVDIIYANSFKLDPKPRSISSSIQDMIAHSEAVDEQLKDKEISSTTPIAPVGKDWCYPPVSNGKATIYGWNINNNQLSWNGIKTHPSTFSGKRVLQPISTIHNIDHFDYSSTVRFMSEIIIDGQFYKCKDVIDKPEFKEYLWG